MGGIPSSRWLAPRVASPELRPLRPPASGSRRCNRGRWRAPVAPAPTPVGRHFGIAWAAVGRRVLRHACAGRCASRRHGPSRWRGSSRCSGASDAAALPADGAPVSVEPAKPAPHPAGDSTLVERVFLAADSLGERLARTMPAERNGGQYGALLLIDSGAAPTRAQRDTLIERWRAASATRTGSEQLRRPLRADPHATGVSGRMGGAPHRGVRRTVDPWSGGPRSGRGSPSA